ncbi:hypothetical protein D3C80_1508080 [compost metagenome]
MVAVPDPDRTGHHLDPEAVQGDVRRRRFDVQLRVQLRHSAPGSDGDQGRADRGRANRPSGSVQTGPDFRHRHGDFLLGADLDAGAEDQYQNWSDHF